MKNTETRAATQPQGGERAITETKTFKTFEEAEQVYLNGLQRLLNVNTWNLLTNSEQYGLLTPKAKLKMDNAQEGDFICIKFPVGKGQTTEEDVLRIDRIVTKLLGHKRSIAVTTIPVRLIMGLYTIEHVVYSEVSYTFVVQLNELEVTAGLYIKNEPGATKNPDSVVDKVRASLKEMFGFANRFEKEWNTLIKSFLK